MDPVRVGLLGSGTVGGGVARVLARNGDEIARRAGRGIVVSRVATRTPARAAGLPLAGVRIDADAHALVAAEDVDVVCELMGGIEPARTLVLAAIARGRHVVTANKALIATHGNEIFAAARERGVIVAFEAAVAGGIPIIKTLREALAGNRVEWLAGIINGTCNYILTAMRDRGLDFATVLSEAQALGYAEADPTFDVDGIDAAHKLSILAAIAFGTPLCFDAVHVEGIRGLAREDVVWAEALGWRIRLLGLARQREAGLELRVHPCLVPARHLLANVDGVLNAVLVQGDAVGPLMLSGAGAGAEATASAVVADLVDVARALTTDPGNRVPHLAFQPDALHVRPVLPIAEVESACYLRLVAEDRPGVLAEVTRIFADLGISLEAVLQKPPAADASQVPIVFLTHPATERRMDEALLRIGALPVIRGPVVRLRIASLD